MQTVGIILLTIYYYKQMIDINLNGSNSFQWTPIGYYNSETDYQDFWGVYDGNGHSISGIYINSSAQSVGLFGEVLGVSTIKNISLSGDLIATTGYWAGGLIGWGGDIIINNCSCSINSISSIQDAGGIIGTGHEITITDCNHSGDVLVTVSNSSSFSGGLIGRADNSRIINCGNMGIVSATSSSNQYLEVAYSGGIIGYVETNADIYNSYNNSNVSSIIQGSYNNEESVAGGIIGYSQHDASITACYNTGNVSASNNSNNGNRSCSGGILGRAHVANIVNSYNVGNVSVTGDLNLGGLVGKKDNGTVTNCYYINTCGGNNTYGGQPMSSDAMQSAEFVTTINNGTCSYEQDVQPYQNQGYPILTGIYISISTLEADGITQSHAALHGTIDVGNVSVQSQGFKYKKVSDNTYQTISVSGSGNIQIYITNLTPNTQYVYRSFCTTNGCGTSYGEEITFTTLPISVATNNASDITQSHATLNGILNIGDAIISSKGFHYKKATDNEYQTVTVSGSGDVSKSLSGLTPNTQYSFRIFCIPQGCDPIYGQENTFNTLSINATTYNATDITQTHATLNGYLNIGDANISSQGFQYKKASDSEYQTVTVSGSGDISTTVSNLIPDTQYRFRLFCTPQNCETVYGQEITFTTASTTVITNNATNVTQTHATLNGSLNGGDIIISAQGFEYKQSLDQNYQTVNVSGNGNISYTVAGLVPNTSYTYRAFYTATDGSTAYGETRTFNTLPISVITNYATNVTAASATLHGSMVIGDATLASKGFEYRISGEYEYSTINANGNDSDFTAQLSGLQTNNTYEYRAFINIAEDAITYYGDTKTLMISWLNQDTIFVNNAETLRWVADQCNSGTTFESKCVMLTNDITLPLNVPNNMISIGSYPDHPFKGTFDGNGKLIHNLYIDQPNTPYQGFFGYTLDANLYNVGLVNITASGRNYTGGMVAFAENTHMSDCYVNGGTLFALSYCGGLVGYQEQGTNSIISGCYNTCTVSGNHYVGGLVGFSNYGTVRNSYVAAPVSGQGNGIGAIIGGANEVLMYNCYFSTEITGQTEAIGENNFKGGEGLTNVQMRDPQFVTTLNQGLATPVWKSDYKLHINNGFPIIMWQRPGTSVDENNVVKNCISLYPNPAHDFVTIQSDDPSVSLLQAEVYDVNGRKVMSVVLDGQNKGFSITKLQAGIYNVRVQTSNGYCTSLKLVVQ